MSYAQFGTIASTDFNTLIGADPAIGSGTLNAVWATGNSNAGYGQTALANVSTGTQVGDAEWANLVSKTSNCNVHQNGGALSSVTAPVAGGKITYQGNIATNLTTIYTNKANAVSQSTTVPYANTRSGTWSNVLTFTHTVTFANADAARYFFNAGGQLAITASHSNVTGTMNTIVNGLCSNIGTVVFSSPGSGTANIAGTAYNGITKVGGGGSTPTISTNSGYHGLANSNVSVFNQVAGTPGNTYLQTFLNVTMKNNYAGGSGATGHYDRGNVINVYTTIDEVPNGLSVASGTVCTLTVRPPEVTNISNTWGTITVAHTNTAT